jgi:ATP-binding cassette, subfamily B, bacterial PglK
VRSINRESRFPTLVTVQNCLALMPREMRWWFALMAPVNFLSGMAEAGAAVAVFALIAMITEPSRAAHIPMLSKLIAFLPWNSPRAQIRAMAGIVAFYYVLKNVLAALVQYLNCKIIGESAAKLKSSLVKGYLTLPYVFHTGRNSADLIWNTTAAIDGPYAESLVAATSVLSEVLAITSIIVVLLYSALHITLAAGLFLVLLLAAMLRVTRAASQRLGTERDQVGRESLRALHEGLGGIKEIQALGREGFFHQLFDEKQRALVRLAYRARALELTAPMLMETVFVCVGIGVLALFVSRGRDTANALPLLALFSYSAFRIVPGANRIVWRLSQLRASAPAIVRIHADAVLIGSLEAEQPTLDAAQSATFRDRIEFENLSYSYPGAAVPALRDINVTVRFGEAIGIVGPTGAGKTTFVDLVVGLLSPSSGRILADGKEISSRDGGWKRHIGYVPQSIYLIDDSFKRNIAFGVPVAEVDPVRLATAIRMAQLEPVIAHQPDGIESPVGERGAHLSGGEKQRIGIARALYHDPDLIVLDEPTSALDPGTERDFTNAIEALRGKKTLLVIAHRLSTVRNCDRLIFLLNGRVHAVGSYDELVRDVPEFRRVAAA